MKKAESYSSFSELSQEERQNARLFFASSSDYDVDKAGRITLSKDHLARAGITKEVVLVGNNDHLEIWDRNTYYAVDKLQDDNFEKNAQYISAQRKKSE